MVFRLQEGIEERRKRNDMRGKERTHTYIERERVSSRLPLLLVLSIGSDGVNLLMHNLSRHAISWPIG